MANVGMAETMTPLKFSKTMAMSTPSQAMGMIEDFSKFTRSPVASPKWCRMVRSSSSSCLTGLMNMMDCGTVPRHKLLWALPCFLAQAATTLSIDSRQELISSICFLL